MESENLQTGRDSTPVSYPLALVGLAVSLWGNQGKSGLMGAKVKAQISIWAPESTVGAVWSLLSLRHIKVTFILRRSSLEVAGYERTPPPFSHWWDFSA